MIQKLFTLSICIVLLNCCFTINAQQIALCESLNDADAHQNDPEFSEVKIRRVRAICDAIYSSQPKPDENDLNSFPEFDMTQIQSDQDAEQILRRFRRKGGRGGGGGGGGGRSGGGGGRFSSGGSRFSFGSRSSSSSGGGSRFFGSRSSSSSSSSSSSGSRIFSRSSSSSSSGTGSRIFSRSSSSSSGGTSSGTGSGSRIFSRSSASSPGATGSSRIFSRSSGSTGTSSDRSSVRIFSRNPTSSHTGNRVREAIRTMIHKPSSSGSGVVPGAGGTNVITGPKPSLSDKIRKITHSGGGGGGGIFSGAGSGISGGSGGSGSSAWVRAGKKFLPHAVRFGKRYYQRRKYSKGMYAGAGAGAGYYAGSRMNHYGHHYPNSHYGYPPVVDEMPETIDGKAPTVFYCIQEDLNATLVNQTLSDEGIGTCNISGQLVTCPIEIECKLSEADNCCEDELGTPYCCGGPIPVEYASEYGGYGDDLEDAAETIHQMLNMFTAICALLATICFTMWHRRGQ